MIDLRRMDDLFLGYATGNLCTAESLCIATLLAMNVEARHAVARLEALGGRVIEEETPVDMQDGCLEEVLKKIAHAPAPCRKMPSPEKMWQDVPEPLRALLHACASVKTSGWSRRTGGGARALQFRFCLQEPAPTVQRRLWLMEIPAGAVVPAHAHGGVEITLVLEGSYRDAFGSYQKGDVSIIAEESAVHSPVGGPNGCVCLTLTQGRVRYADPLLRLMSLFLGGR